MNNLYKILLIFFLLFLLLLDVFLSIYFHLYINALVKFFIFILHLFLIVMQLKLFKWSDFKNLFNHPNISNKLSKTLSNVLKLNILMIIIAILFIIINAVISHYNWYPDLSNYVSIPIDVDENVNNIYNLGQIKLEYKNTKNVVKSITFEQVCRELFLDKRPHMYMNNFIISIDNFSLRIEDLRAVLSTFLNKAVISKHSKFSVQFDQNYQKLLRWIQEYDITSFEDFFLLIIAIVASKSIEIVTKNNEKYQLWQFMQKMNVTKPYLDISYPMTVVDSFEGYFRYYLSLSPDIKGLFDQDQFYLITDGLKKYWPYAHNKPWILTKFYGMILYNSNQ